MDPWILKLQQEAIRIASRYRRPEFYVRFNAPMALARRLYFSDSIVVYLRDLVRPILQDRMGHGLLHSTRVSLDAATLVHVELNSNPVSREQLEKLMVLGLVAGLLHDICRNESNHAESGALEAARMLKDLPLPMSRDEIQCVCLAIRNHEAFVAPVPSNRPWFQLISDCLYDADKFRWGPDTFTHTLWHMMDHQHLNPRELLEKFPWGMTGVRRVMDTFRTATGRQYGPEIIETGMEMGKEIYRSLLQFVRDNYHDQ